MVFCSSCGEKLNLGVKFCESCGAKTQSGASPPSTALQVEVYEGSYWWDKYVYVIVAIITAILLFGFMVGFISNIEGI